MQQFPQHSAISPSTWVLVGMIAFAVCVRLLIYFVPGALPYNFTPVEAIALFGGAYFSDRRLAFIVPLGAMFVADFGHRPASTASADLCLYRRQRGARLRPARQSVRCARGRMRHPRLAAVLRRGQFRRMGYRRYILLPRRYRALLRRCPALPQKLARRYAAVERHFVRRVRANAA